MLCGDGIGGRTSYVMEGWSLDFDATFTGESSYIAEVDSWLRRESLENAREYNRTRTGPPRTRLPHASGTASVRTIIIVGRGGRVRGWCSALCLEYLNLT